MRGSRAPKAFISLLLLAIPEAVLAAGSTSPAGSFEVGVLGVKLRFSALDERGNAVTDLKADELTLQEDGAAQTVRKLVYERSGVSVALVVDSSESMTFRMDDAISAGERFLDLMDPEDEIAIVDFDSEVRVLAPLASGGAGVSLLRSMKADGGTHLYDALARAAELLSGSKGRRGVVLLSDGEDGSLSGGSKSRLADVLERAKRDEIEIHAVGVGLAVNRFELKEMAEKTGGTFAFAEESSALRKIYEKIPRELVQGYTLEYDSTNAAHDGRFRKVTLQVSRPGVTVRVREGFYAPGAAGPGDAVEAEGAK